MKSNYKKIGDHIRLVDERNAGHKVKTLLGLSISKQFIPSVANIIGTDMENYKIIRKNQFACSTMQVRRDKKMPVALLQEVDEAMISQAYQIFEVTDTTKLLPEYLMMWFTRQEFDREACFYAIGGVRGSLEWEDFCDMKLPIPKPDKQKEIAKEYNTIVNRIALNNQLIQKLEETAQAIYKQWFVDFEFPNEEGKLYKSSGGEMEMNLELEKEIPNGWEVVLLSNVSKLITKGTTPEEMFSEPTSDKIFFLKGEAFTDNHGFDEKNLSYIDKKTNASLRRSIVEEDDILLTIAGTLGKFAKATKRILPANTNQAVGIIRLDQSKISSNYLYWLFLGNWHQLFIATNLQQAVQANLSLTTVGLLPLVIPDENNFKKINKLINP